MQDITTRIAILGATCAILSLTGCAPQGFPENPLLTVDESLAYPRIEPLEALPQPPELPSDPSDPDPDLQARGDALRTRADAIRRQSN
ncbi:hypothetical protein [Qingshengfaniella alkalisoli]|uniref:Uncharacterized protein n=1 Tax=Qingshengfaniella alkalisoli TaxID=2599296 RepID=A0A5B8IRN1_9RHOB|nr:hypothetical protein [Qingshengfaniella alkalisoli]QDY68862.1 hypothetical protein FPZ52_03930 [Qingshengfaniella alkalisoli]